MLESLKAHLFTFSPRHPDNQYKHLLRDILKNGERVGDRTGIGTTKVFERQMRFDAQWGYPLLTTKEVSFPLVAKELLWFISGSSNIRPLVMEGVHIWDEWPYQRWLEKTRQQAQFPKYTDSWKQEKKNFAQRIREDQNFAEEFGNLGPVYGFQWRHWQTRKGKEIDQLAEVIHNIQKKPFDRRHIVTAWNPEDVPQAALPPCHRDFQLNVSPKGFLDLSWTQRSVDSFLGLPFNIASYALLLKMIAQVTGLKDRTTVFKGADTHIYRNHKEQVNQQLTRRPHPLSQVTLNPEIRDIDDFEFSDINLINYRHHPAIRAPIAV